jgi:glycosyltransferase involved in cell wall biosynthesis
LSKTVLFVIAEDWYAYSHRLDQMKALQEAGFTVKLASNFNNHHHFFHANGIETIQLSHIKRDNLNPFTELLTIFELYRVYRSTRPTILHHVGVKLVLNGMIAATLAGLKKSVNVFAGLGYLFLKQTLWVKAIRALVVWVLQWCFRGGEHRIVCQNHEDARALKQHFPTSPQHVILGAGIDLHLWHPPAQAPQNQTPKIILAARMVANKGILEAVTAVRELNLEGVACELHLVGEPDPGNPGTISNFQLHTWDDQSQVYYHGKQDDVQPWIHASDIACLPSYTEGLPKALLEAAACGLPLVGSNIPGIREIIIENETGLLITAGDVTSLKTALKLLIFSSALRQKIGQAARQLMEKKFSKTIINQEIVALHEKLHTTP